MNLIFTASISSVLEFFHQGGVFMVLLLVCSIVTLTVIMMRSVALKRQSVMPDAIEKSIEELQPGDDGGAVVHLARMVRSDPSPLARVVQTGLQNLQWPKSENVEAVQTRARHEILRLESGLAVLEVIVGIAPLLGLLGAVSGMVKVFGSFGQTAAGSDPHGIARGISEALNTTIVGLAIAIPALIAHSYFSKKIEKMACEMESLIAELLAKCYYQKRRQQQIAQFGIPTEPSELADHLEQPVP